MKSEWITTTLGDEIELAYGKGLPASSRDGGQVPVFGSNGVVGFHSVAAVEGPGIIIGRKGSVGIVSFSKGSFWPIDTTYFVVNKHGHDWRFLFYFLSGLGLTELNSHSAIPGVNREDVYSITVRLPTIDEQKNIALVLDLISDAILREQKALDAASSLKKAVAQELFTSGTFHKPRKEVAVGFVPEHWQVEELGSLAEIAYGAQAAVATATDPAPGTLILTNVNITLDGSIDLQKKRYYRVAGNQRDRLMLQKGDVLFNWRSGSPEHVGKTAYFDMDGEYTYSSFILRFRTQRAIDGKFLYRYLAYLRMTGFFSSRRNVSSINSVYNASLARTIPIWFPGPEEQATIVTILDAIDSKVGLHKRKIKVLTELFNAIRANLMAAKIRVDDLPLATLERPRSLEVSA